MERLVAGKLDAFFLSAGYPAKVVQWAGEQTAISLVPITGEPTAVLVRLNPFLRRDSIRAGGYPGVGEVATLTVAAPWIRQEGHTSELQSLMRTSYADVRLKKKQNIMRRN